MKPTSAMSAHVIQTNGIDLREMSDVDPSKPWVWSWHMFDPGVLPKIFRHTTEHGQCGCCSMVAASAACSVAYAIKTARPPLELAVQELINEVPKYYWDEMTVNENDLCASAYTSTSFKYIKRFHIGMAGDLPYEGRPTDAGLPPNMIFIHWRVMDLLVLPVLQLDPVFVGVMKLSKGKGKAICVAKGKKSMLDGDLEKTVRRPSVIWRCTKVKWKKSKGRIGRKEYVESRCFRFVPKRHHSSFAVFVELTNLLCYLQVSRGET